MSQQNQDGSVNLKVTHVAIDANNIDMLSVSSEFYQDMQHDVLEKVCYVTYIYSSIVSDTVSIY